MKKDETTILDIIRWVAVATAVVIGALAGLFKH